MIKKQSHFSKLFIHCLYLIHEESLWFIFGPVSVLASDEKCWLYYVIFVFRNNRKCNGATLRLCAVCSNCKFQTSLCLCFILSAMQFWMLWWNQIVYLFGSYYAEALFEWNLLTRFHCFLGNLIGAQCSHAKYSITGYYFLSPS